MGRLGSNDLVKLATALRKNNQISNSLLLEVQLIRYPKYESALCCWVLGSFAIDHITTQA